MCPFSAKCRKGDFRGEWLGKYKNRCCGKTHTITNPQSGKLSGLGQSARHIIRNISGKLNNSFRRLYGEKKNKMCVTKISSSVVIFFQGQRKRVGIHAPKRLPHEALHTPALIYIDSISILCSRRVFHCFSWSVLEDFEITSFSKVNNLSV